MVVELESIEDFYALLSEKKHLIMEATAGWCGPCKRIYPEFKRLEEKYLDITFAKFDVDKAEELSELLKVRAMPTFFMFKNTLPLREFKGGDPAILRAQVADFQTQIEQLQNQAVVEEKVKELEDNQHPNHDDRDDDDDVVMTVNDNEVDDDGQQNNYNNAENNSETTTTSSKSGNLAGSFLAGAMNVLKNVVNPTNDESFDDDDDQNTNNDDDNNNDDHNNNNDDILDIDTMNMLNMLSNNESNPILFNDIDEDLFIESDSSETLYIPISDIIE